MQLLSRDPSDRPTMLEFYQACTSVFIGSTTNEHAHARGSVDTLSDADGRGAGTAALDDGALGATGQTVTETMYMTEML